MSSQRSDCSSTVPLQTKADGTTWEMTPLLEFKDETLPAELSGNVIIDASESMVLGLSTIWPISLHILLSLGLQVINQSQVWLSAFHEYSYQPEQLPRQGNVYTRAV